MKCETRGDAEDINFTGASWKYTILVFIIIIIIVTIINNNIYLVIKFRLSLFNTILSAERIDDTGPVIIHQWNNFR